MGGGIPSTGEFTVMGEGGSDLAAITKIRNGWIRVIFPFLTSRAPVVVVDLPLLRVAVEGSENPITLEQPCQASLLPD